MSILECHSPACFPGAGHVCFKQCLEHQCCCNLHGQYNGAQSDILYPLWRIWMLVLYWERGQKPFLIDQYCFGGILVPRNYTNACWGASCSGLLPSSGIYMELQSKSLKRAVDFSLLATAFGPYPLQRNTRDIANCNFWGHLPCCASVYEMEPTSINK